MTPSLPAAMLVCRALAVVQPQETRTLLTCSVEPVLLTSRKGWTATVPCGTAPKSFVSSSNIASAHGAARADWANANRRVLTRLNRNMVIAYEESPEATCVNQPATRYQGVRNSQAQPIYDQL